MIAIFEIRSAAIKPFVAVGGVAGRIFRFVVGYFRFWCRLITALTLFNNEDGNQHQHNKDIRSPFLIQANKFGTN